jgi:hypothetical protein
VGIDLFRVVVNVAAGLCLIGSEGVNDGNGPNEKASSSGLEEGREDRSWLSAARAQKLAGPKPIYPVASLCAKQVQERGRPFHAHLFLAGVFLLWVNPELAVP